jgi:hypothetical protein
MFIWILLLIFIFIIILLSIEYENFAGALTQLYAKGPQDNYLTVDTEKYIPPYLNNPYWIWNQPTRLASPYYYPLYGIFPPYFRSLPYYNYWY